MLPQSAGFRFFHLWPLAFVCPEPAWHRLVISKPISYRDDLVIALF